MFQPLDVGNLNRDLRVVGGRVGFEDMSVRLNASVSVCIRACMLAQVCESSNGW